MIQQSEIYKGLKTHTTEHSIMLYADDVVFVMTSPDDIESDEGNDA